MNRCHCAPRRALAGLAWALACAVPLAVGAAQAAAPAAASAASAAAGAPHGPHGDPARGEPLYGRCIACHALAYDRTGPRHCGLLGRRAGTVPGFGYSKAMKESGIVWTVTTLDTFLADPMKAMPGTAMGYAGVRDPQERADLVAYLAQASDSAQCRR